MKTNRVLAVGLAAAIMVGAPAAAYADTTSSPSPAASSFPTAPTGPSRSPEFDALASKVTLQAIAVADVPIFDQHSGIQKELGYIYKGDKVLVSPEQDKQYTAWRAVLGKDGTRGTLVAGLTVAVLDPGSTDLTIKAQAIEPDVSGGLLGGLGTVGAMAIEKAPSNSGGKIRDASKGEVFDASAVPVEGPDMGFSTTLWRYIKMSDGTTGWIRARMSEPVDATDAASATPTATIAPSKEGLLQKAKDLVVGKESATATSVASDAASTPAARATEQPGLWGKAKNFFTGKKTAVVNAVDFVRDLPMMIAAGVLASLALLAVSRVGRGFVGRIVAGVSAGLAAAAAFLVPASVPEWGTLTLVGVCAVSGLALAWSGARARSVLQPITLAAGIGAGSAAYIATTLAGRPVFAGAALALLAIGAVARFAHWVPQSGGRHGGSAPYSGGEESDAATPGTVPAPTAYKPSVRESDDAAHMAGEPEMAHAASGRTKISLDDWED